MARFLYALVVGLLGAAIVHFAIIILMPYLSENSAWRYVEANTQTGVPVRLTEPPTGRTNLFLDPLFKASVCRFDLADGGVRLTASGTTEFWSVGVYDTAGSNIFSANDRIANSPSLDLAVLNSAQLRFARQNTPDELANSVVAATDDDQGFVVLRVFSPDATWAPSSDEFLESLTCETLAY